eukprot:g5004.t1
MGLCTSAAQVGPKRTSSSVSKTSAASSDDGFTNLREASESAKRNTASFLRVVMPHLSKALEAYHRDRQDDKSKKPLSLVLDHESHGKRPQRRKNGASTAYGQTKFENGHMEVLIGKSSSSSPLISGLTNSMNGDMEQTDSPIHWEEIEGDNGQKYYFCPSTGETTWDKPANFCSAGCKTLSFSGHAFSSLSHVSRLLQWSTGPMTALVTLRLQDNSIADEGIATLSDALISPSCCKLRVLQLDGNHIGDAGCQALAVALREKTLALRTLKLDRQKKSRITVAGVGAIAESLSCDSCSLENLSFSGNKSVGCECGKRLARAILSRQGGEGAVSELYLSGTGVSDDGAQSLALALPFLSTISLSGCRIKDVGGRALANALKSAAGDKGACQNAGENFRLKGFDLQGNYFNPGTIAMLVENTPSGSFRTAAEWMRPAGEVLTHTQVVTRLYRHSLKCMMSWAIQRDIINEEAALIRARFEANANVAPDS